MSYPGVGMSPPPTAGSMHSVPPGMPVGPPMPPPGMMDPAGYPGVGMNGPPTAQSLGPSMPMGGPPMSGPMGGPPMSGQNLMGGPPMSGQMGGSQMSEPWQAPYTDPHMGGPMHGFGPQMNASMPEIRHAPHRHRPENQELPEEKREVLKHPMRLADGNILPSGSDKYALYGALEDLNKMEMADQRDKLKRRRRVNCIPALNSLFLPWVLFLVVFSLSSFYFHYVAPFTVTFLNSMIVLSCLIYAYRSFSDPTLRPDVSFYPTYLAVMFLLAASLGWLLGDLNFWFNMQPAYNVEHLGTYETVNPSKHKTRSGQEVPTSGRRYQDAGKIYFNHNAVLDLNRSMSFKMGDLYCVAPIVDPTCKKNCGFDFWAVGINCCAEDVADFRCGEYDNPTAKAGLRLMHDEQRPNFRLAVLEAEGVHKVVSTHPLFFYWLHDPNKELQHIKHKGFREFVLLMIVSFFGSCLASYLALKWAREKFKYDS